MCVFFWLVGWLVIIIIINPPVDQLLMNSIKFNWIFFFSPSFFATDQKFSLFLFLFDHQIVSRYYWIENWLISSNTPSPSNHHHQWIKGVCVWTHSFGLEWIQHWLKKELSQNNEKKNWSASQITYTNVVNQTKQKKPRVNERKKKSNFDPKKKRN